MSAAVAVVILIIAIVIGYILYDKGYISFDSKTPVALADDKNERSAEDDDKNERSAEDDDKNERSAEDDAENERSAEDDAENERSAEDENTVILVPIAGLAQRKKGNGEACAAQEDCASGLDCRPGSDGTTQCLRRRTMASVPGADKVPVPGTNLGEIEEGDRFFIRSRHFGRCIGLTDNGDLEPSPVGYGCKGEYKDPCNPVEGGPIEDQCSYGYVCEADTDGVNKCLLNPSMTNYTEDKLPMKQCSAWTIPCDTTDEKYHWTSIDIPGTNKQKFKLVGTNQCLALRGNNTSQGWKNHTYLLPQPCDVEPQEFVQWEKRAEPLESGVVNGEIFVPDPYYSLKSATPNNKCIRMSGWNYKRPTVRPYRDTCERTSKNSLMHFNFPIINA